MILKANQIYGQIDILHYLILFLFNNVVFIFIFKKQLKNTFYYLVFYSNVFSVVLYLLVIPSFTMLWTSRNIAISLKNNEYIFHAGTKLKDNKILNSGGRVLNFVAVSNNLKKSREGLIKLINRLDWKDGFFRKDIAHKVID